MAQPNREDEHLAMGCCSVSRGHCYECSEEFDEPLTVWRKSEANGGQRMPYLVPPCHPKAAWQFARYLEPRPPVERPGQQVLPL